LFHRRLPALRVLIASLTGCPKESVAIYLAVAFFPTVLAIGAAVDYSRANNFKTAMQVALDAAVLSGGSNGRKDWAEVALNAFEAKLSSKYDPYPKPIFFQEASTGNYIGTVTGSWPTSALGIINISSINVTAKATAVADHDIAFILNLDNTPSRLNTWTASKLFGDALLTTSAGQQTALNEGVILSPGNKIRTGQNGRVLLVRGQETILIASNSVVGLPEDVTQGMSTTIYQWAGSVLFVGDHKQFEVETPHLAAVVRGTRFRVTVNKDDTNVEVLGGRVEVTDFQSGQYVLVLPGQAVEVLVQGSPGLSLSGSGTLNPILQGMPRKSAVDRIVLSDERFSKVENEWVPPSSESDHPAGDDSRSSGLSALGRLFSNANGQRDAAAMFGIVFAGALGAAVGVAAYLLLRSENKGRARSFRLAGRFYLPSPRSRRWRLWRILRR
jgi:hypothetical protein